MKRLLSVLIVISIPSIIYSQSIDFGLEFRASSNTMQFSKFFYPTLEGVVRPGYYEGNPYQIQFPAQHHDFRNEDDNSEEVHGFWDEATVKASIEVPLCVRYVTKRGWFVNWRIAVNKYKIDYGGYVFKNVDYYNSEYGDFDNYLANYAGSFIEDDVNLNYQVQYNDTTAFINYFAASIDQDPYTALRMKRVEELKFYSTYLSLGKKFFQHKIIHPYFSAGLGYRLAVGNQKREYMEFGDASSEVTVMNDMLGITQRVNLFNWHAITARFELGAEFYRYRFGAAYDLTSSFYKDDGGGEKFITNYGGVLKGMQSWTFYLGLDLFSKQLKTVSNKDDVYLEEYSTLGSKVDDNRKWSFVARIKAPLVAQMESYGTHYIGDYTDIPNPVDSTNNLKMHLLEFNKINNVNWTPKFEVAVRYSPFSRLETELELGVNRLQLDTGVDDFSAIILTDSTGKRVYDEPTKRRNASTFRIQFIDASAKLNLYYRLFTKGLVKFKLLAGGGINIMFDTGKDVVREFGVNGNGNDVYSRLEDYYWQRPASHYNGFTFYSEMDYSWAPTGDAEDMRNRLESAGWGPLDGWDRRRKPGYVTVNFGFEAEINRFLIGFNYELSVGSVDNVFIKNYNKGNLSLGYMLFTKNGFNRKTTRTTF